MMKERMTLAHKPPTFPVDSEVLNHILRELVWTAPVTLLPLIALPVAAITLGWTALAAGIAGGLTMGALGMFWAKRWKRLHKEARGLWMERSNEAQNAELRGIIAHLGYIGCRNYASILREIAHRKETIEKRLKGNIWGDETTESVENLVDHTSTEACREITKLIRGDERLGSTILSGDRDKLTAAETTRKEGHLRLLDTIVSLRKMDRELSRELALKPERASRSSDYEILIEDLDDHASWMNRAHRRVSKDTSSTETTTTETHGLALSD
ncbi:MAG: hypothetical protein QNL77_06510 [Akkermansiaceae bacterium]